MKIEKTNILHSPSDLNNFVSCKFYISNDLLANESNLKKKKWVQTLSSEESTEKNTKKNFKIANII